MQLSYWQEIICLWS